jgi:hypothetical protein
MASCPCDVQFVSPWYPSRVSKGPWVTFFVESRVAHLLKHFGISLGAPGLVRMILEGKFSPGDLDLLD